MPLGTSLCWFHCQNTTNNSKAAKNRLYLLKVNCMTVMLLKIFGSKSCPIIKIFSGVSVKLRLPWSNQNQPWTWAAFKSATLIFCKRQRLFVCNNSVLTMTLSDIGYDFSQTEFYQDSLLILLPSRSLFVLSSPISVQL